MVCAEVWLGSLPPDKRYAALPFCDRTRQTVEDRAWLIGSRNVHHNVEKRAAELTEQINANKAK